MRGLSSGQKKKKKEKLHVCSIANSGKNNHYSKIGGKKNPKPNPTMTKARFYGNREGKRRVILSTVQKKERCFLRFLFLREGFSIITVKSSSSFAFFSVN